MIGQKVKVYHPTKKDQFGQKKIVEINARTLDKAVRDMGYIRVDSPQSPPTLNNRQSALDTIARLQAQESVTTTATVDLPSDPVKVDLPSDPATKTTTKTNKK